MITEFQTTYNLNSEGNESSVGVPVKMLFTYPLNIALLQRRNYSLADLKKRYN